MYMLKLQGYYSVYGGTSGQYPVYGTGPAGGLMTGTATAAFYPYLQFGAEGSGGGATYASGGQSYGHGHGHGVQYPHHHLFQYSPLNSTTAGGTYSSQHYAAPISLAPSPALPSGNFTLLPFYFILVFSSLLTIKKPILFNRLCTLLEKSRT